MPENELRDFIRRTNLHKLLLNIERLAAFQKSQTAQEALFRKFEDRLAEVEKLTGIKKKLWPSISERDDE